MRALSCALFAIPMWKGDLCGESMFVFMSRPSERIMRFSLAQRFSFLFVRKKKSSACVSKALIVLSASSLQKKNFQKKILNGGSLGSHVDEGRSKMRELV